MLGGRDTCAMASSDYLTNQFLIAMPALADTNFAQTVTFIWEHNDEGALGIIINRPLQMRLVDVFEQLKMPTCFKAARCKQTEASSYIMSAVSGSTRSKSPRAFRSRRRPIS
jgi:putative AlgH/UPF0301 family transcriptional regulator